MISNSGIKWGLGAIMIGVFGVTVTYLMQQISKLVNTKWSLLGTEIKNISINEISLVIWWRVLNESDFSFSISNQVFDVYLNGRLIKKIGFSPKVNIPTNSDSRVPTAITITAEELILAGLSFIDLLQNKEGRSKLFLEVKGNMELSIDDFKIKQVPFYFKDSIQSIMNY
jgi:LEA14-like dessication related protein